MEDTKIQELVEKVKSGTASDAEKLSLVKELNALTSSLSRDLAQLKKK